MLLTCSPMAVAEHRAAAFSGQLRRLSEQLARTAAEIYVVKRYIIYVKIETAAGGIVQVSDAIRHEQGIGEENY